MLELTGALEIIKVTLLFSWRFWGPEKFGSSRLPGSVVVNMGLKSGYLTAGQLSGWCWDGLWRASSQRFSGSHRSPPGAPTLSHLAYTNDLLSVISGLRHLFRASGLNSLSCTVPRPLTNAVASWMTAPQYSPDHLPPNTHNRTLLRHTSIIPSKPQAGLHWHFSKMLFSTSFTDVSQPSRTVSGT